MTVAVSVVLPVFNGQRWLAPAIESICRQTHPISEVLVVDDGSSDESLAIASNLSRKYRFIKVLRNERNAGIVESLNRGIEAATGTYIARMDADDICRPDRIARQLQFVTETGCDFCGSWFVEFGRGPSRTVRWPASEEAVRTSMMFQNSFCHPTMLVHRSVFERFRYRKEYSLAEDYDLFGRALSHFRGANVPHPLLKYRRHPAQATYAKRDAMERVTERIRIEYLSARGVATSQEQKRVHNLIRAPESIRSLEDLESIEAWLATLLSVFPHAEARQVIASQWIRACIRAAPLGLAMLRSYRSSSLTTQSGAGASVFIDLLVLAILRLDYSAKAFSLLRRIGVSA